MQSVLRPIYPPQCLSCDALTESDFALCSDCWRETPFVGGLVCDACGTPLIGQNDGDAAFCDECLATSRPWSKGRTALLYQDTARRIVLALKHGDRTDLAGPAARWMAQAAKPLLRSYTLIAPVPLHWSRLLKRGYNQSALLANALAKNVERDVIPDLLLRTKRTKALEGHTHDQRFKALDGAISANPKYADQIKGRSVLLIDDVMTSGATLSACTNALHSVGTKEICVLTLARVAKTP
jgi:ComF family protein